MRFEDGASETKAIAVEVKADDQGRIEGYASRFGEKDRGGDIVVKGAYAESVSRQKPKMLWQHDPAQPIGVWDEASEDDSGLYVRGRVLSTVEKGREALALIGAGAIDGMSIGYRTVDADRASDGSRLLKRLELWEVSLVTFPMLESARIDTIKAAEMTPREMERLLTRDAGLSRTVAKALMGGGMSAVKAMREAGDSGLSEIAQLMRETYGKGKPND
jgi:HK97 family phage prohead protease